MSLTSYRAALPRDIKYIILYLILEHKAFISIYDKCQFSIIKPLYSKIILRYDELIILSIDYGYTMKNNYYGYAMQAKILLATACAAALLTTGCAPKLGGSDYNVANVGDISRSLPGVVISKRVIQIHASDPSKPGIGAGVGAGAGALAGSAVGNGKGNLLAMGIGGVAAAFAGHYVEQSLTHQEGFEYQVRMDKTGEVLAIAQGAEPNIPVGGLVYVVENIRSNGLSALNEGKKGRSRIIPR